MSKFFSRRWWALPFLSIAALLATQTSAAQPVGDVARGANLGYTCLGCHGIPNYKNAYPNYRVPKVYGQHPDYLASALQAYKAGERSHATMHANAASLNEQDMADVAAWISGPKVAVSTAQPVGKLPAAGQVCVSCHGADGVGITPQYPSLAGQYEDYIARSLTDYKKGNRKNAIMAGFAAQLSDKDILELAAYYSSQRSVLGTPPRRLSRYAAR